MKIIRLWGVVAFFGLGIILALIWYLVAPKLIKNGIEVAGTEALGAQVDVDGVELALFPLRIEINRLQVTDPDQPMSNLFEVEQINFALDSNALLWKKVLIEELTIKGVQLGSNRTTSGAIENRETELLVNKVSSFELPTLNEKNINKMVAKADLITIKRLDKLNKNQQSLQKYWKSALDKQAFEERTESIKKEFKRLSNRAKKSKMNLILDRKAWKKLKKNIDKERSTISDLNKKLKQDRKDLQQQIKDVRQGPKDDLDAIMGKMGLGNGFSGLSDKFLGPQFAPWIEKGLSMADGMTSSDPSTEEAPVYSTSRGSVVKFKDRQIFPDLLIKKLKLSGNDEHWGIDGVGANIGYFPWLIGKPSTLNLDIAANGSEEGAANVAVKSDWSSANKMKIDIDSAINNWQVTKMKLMQTDQGNWMVNSGKLNATLTGQFTLEQVNLRLSIKLSKPNIAVPENLSGWQKILASSLNQQKHLSIDVTATGSFESPEIKVKSSIEKLFSQAIGAKVKQQTEKLKGKFSSAISEKVGDLSSLDGISGDFDQWINQLKGNDNLLKKWKSGI